jgi:hypothetical protein
MIKTDDIIDVILLPKNEAEHPETAKVKIKAQIPTEDKSKEVFLGELLQQTKQDFGFVEGEFLMINVTMEDGKMSAYCLSSMKEQSI